MGAGQAGTAVSATLFAPWSVVWEFVPCVRLLGHRSQRCLRTRVNQKKKNPWQSIKPPYPTACLRACCMSSCLVPPVSQTKIKFPSVHPWPRKNGDISFICPGTNYRDATEFMEARAVQFFGEAPWPIKPHRVVFGVIQSLIACDREGKSTWLGQNNSNLAQNKTAKNHHLPPPFSTNQGPQEIQGTPKSAETVFPDIP